MLSEYLQMSLTPIAVGLVMHTQPGVCSSAKLCLFPPVLSRETLRGPDERQHMFRILNCDLYICFVKT